jgi:hypothetical protein
MTTLHVSFLTCNTCSTRPTSVYQGIAGNRDRFELAFQTLFRRSDDADGTASRLPNPDMGLNINDFRILADSLLVESSLALGAVRASAKGGGQVRQTAQSA